MRNETHRAWPFVVVEWTSLDGLLTLAMVASKLYSFSAFSVFGHIFFGRPTDLYFVNLTHG